MAHRLALAYLGIASFAISVCSFFSGNHIDLAFIVLVMGFPVALIAVAVERKGRLGPLLMPLIALTILLEGCGVAIFFLKGQVLQGAWVAGLPVSAAIQLFGLWMGPLLLVALAYGLTFDRWDLPEEDLRRFDARRLEKRRNHRS